MKLSPLVLSLLIAISSKGQDLQTVTTTGNTTDKVIQITGANKVPGNGAGLELFKFSSDGVVQAYDRVALVPLKLRIQPNAASLTTINDVGGRLLVGGTADDGSTALQVSGGIKSTTGVYRALTGNLANNIIMTYGYNEIVQDYTSIKVAGVAANTAELRLVQNGNVGIGIPNPQSKLAVNGDITAKKVKVTLVGWPDFVFYQDYKLPSLKEVEDYIAINKHLSSVPSAKEVEANGLDLGEMNKQLLQKVEELTLYLIEEHKKNLEQQKEIAELNQRLKKVENQ